MSTEIIPHGSIIVKPRNYRMVFSGNGYHGPITMDLKVTDHNIQHLVEFVRLPSFGFERISEFLDIPIDIEAFSDDDNGAQYRSAQLSAPRVELELENDNVTLYVHGYPHAIQVGFKQFQHNVELMLKLATDFGLPDTQTPRPVISTNAEVGVSDEYLMYGRGVGVTYIVSPGKYCLGAFFRGSDAEWGRSHRLPMHLRAVDGDGILRQVGNHYDAATARFVSATHSIKLV